MMRYDFTELNRFLDEDYSPEYMKEEIVKLVFNYIENAPNIDKEVKNDICTLYLLYNQLSNIKPIQKEGGQPC